MSAFVAGTTAHAEDALVAACKATDPDTSIAACSRLLDTNPSPDLAELAWRTRGFRLQVKGDHAKAVADFTEALGLKPAYYGTLTARGSSYVRLNDFDRAAADFDAALRLKSDYAPAFSGRSMLDFFRGRLDQAIADASEAIRLDPKQTAAFNNRGIALREKGDFDGSLNDLNVAIRLSPFASRPLYNRGLTYFRKGDLQHALSDYDAALTLNPKETDALQGREIINTILASRGSDKATQATAPVPPPVGAVSPGATGKVAVIGQAGRGDAPALVGSREPDAGTRWEPFAAEQLGLRLLVQQPQNPADRFVFSEKEDWLEVRPVSGGPQIQATRVIRVLGKRPDQTVEQAIAEGFVAELPPVARDSCKVVRAEAPIDPGPGRYAFEIMPTGSYGRTMRARMRKEPASRPGAMGCGSYGAGEATAYFEYHPDEDTSRYLYVFTGFEQPFDEKSIKLVAPTVSNLPPVTPMAPAMVANDKASPMIGFFAAPNRTLSVSAAGASGRFAVTLRVDMPGGCSGEAEGTGTGSAPNGLTVSVPDPSGGAVCAIGLSYDRAYGSVQIGESGACLTWHGAQCDFVGKLTRRR